MAITLLAFPAAQWSTDDGDPLALGVIYFYEPGTSTPKSAYPTRADAVAGTSALANPLSLTAAGRKQVWLDGQYDVLVYTEGGIASGTLIDTILSVGDTSDVNVLPQGYLNGFPTSVDTDTDHDVLIGVGEARDAADSEDIVLAAAITKQIDAAWALGDDAGGMDTGSVAASTFYYIHAIKRSDTGVVDALFSLSPTAPTLPTNYDKFRVVGTLTTDGNANIIGWSLFSPQELDTITAAEQARTIIGPTTPRRALNLNGDFQVDQAGGTKAVSSSSVFIQEMWRWVVNGTPGGAANIARDTDVPTGYTGYSLKIDCTTAEAAVATTERLMASTFIEAQNLQRLRWGGSLAKPVGLRFAIKSPKTGTHCVALHQPDDTRSYVAEFTVAAANTWQWVTVAVPGDTVGVIDNDNGTGLRIDFPLVAGTDFHATAGAWAAGDDSATANQQNLLDNTANNIFLFGVDLMVLETVSDQILECERLPYGEAYARCLRYFERWAPGDDKMLGMGTAIDTETIAGTIDFAPKRSSPTITASNVTHFKAVDNGGDRGGSSALSFPKTWANKTQINFTCAATPFTATEPVRILTNNASFTLDFSAELA